jgi:hypothetical protein
VKVYKITMVIVERDDAAKDEIVSFLSLIDYAEHCLSHPVFITAIERDVGSYEVVEAEIARLFGGEL